MASKEVCCVCGNKLDFMATYNKDFRKVCSSCNKIIKSELNFGALRGIGDVSTIECIEVYQCYLQKNSNGLVESINNINHKIETISQKKRTSIGVRFIGILLIVFGVILTYNTIFGNGDRASSQFSYEVKQSGFSEIDGLYSISGIVTNNSGHNVDYLKIEFICYDKDGNNIGTIYDMTQNLLVDDSWSFESTYIGNKDVDHCDFYKIIPSTVIFEIN